MMGTITNCYIGGTRTSAIALRDLRATCPMTIAPSDFFLAMLFNNSAGGNRGSRLKWNFPKVDLLQCSCRIGIDRDGLFDIVETNMNTIQWKRGRKMWTADVGKIKCTITPPKASDPLPLYFWYTRGPAPYWDRNGGASSLEACKRMVAQAIEEGSKKAAQDPANITSLSAAEVGI